jgi:hypothetical protein
MLKDIDAHLQLVITIFNLEPGAAVPQDTDTLNYLTVQKDRLC